MKITLVQVASPQGENVDRRRDRVAGMVAAAKGADLVVLPELWNLGYCNFDTYSTGAEVLDGPTVTAGKAWALELGCFVHLGSLVVRDEEGLLFNTAVMIDPTGAVAHTYQKVHVFGYESQEARLLAKGDGVSVVQTPFGAVGVTTCYDLRFPELWVDLVDAGAQVVVVPAAWPASRLAHWRTLTACRALEEQIVLVACNAVGQQAGVEMAGHSRVVGPWGDVFVEAGVDEGLTTISVDPGIVDVVRTKFPVLQDRRSCSHSPLTATQASRS